MARTCQVEGSGGTGKIEPLAEASLMAAEAHSFGVYNQPGKFHVHIFAPNDFTMIDYECVVEPLRLANKISNVAFFSWSLVTEHGEPVRATNGAMLSPQWKVADVRHSQAVIVLGPHDPALANEPAVIGWLRRLFRHDTLCVGLDYGVYYLARAGLLDGRRATLHWESINSFRSEFPEIHVEDRRYIRDGKLLTGSGGIPTLDVMNHIIEAWSGPSLAAAVARICVYDPSADGREVQLRNKVKVLGTNRKVLIDAVAIMENETEEPITIGELAVRLGLSRRQLEREFRQELDESPAGFYLHTRLAKAREMVRKTRLALGDISAQCGFRSRSQFARRYRDRFGVTPRTDRLSVD